MWIMVNAMSGRRRMEFYICTARRVKRRKITGGAKLIVDGVDTTTNIFMQSYRNSKRHGITLHQYPGGNASNTPSGKNKKSQQK